MRRGVMSSRSTIRIIARAVCAIALFASWASAQTTTSARTVKFEVVSVVGNQLVVKLPEGTREMTVPDTTRFIVDGKQMTVRELKAGMAGEATITTTTTLVPVYVTEVRNVRVMQAMGNSAIIRAADGTFKLITQEDIDKYKVQITRNGQPIEFQQLKAQDAISATLITTKNETLTQQQVDARLAAVTGAPAAASPAPARPAASPMASPMASPFPPAASPAPAKELPKTASPLPLVALMGAGLVALGGLLTLARRRASN